MADDFTIEQDAIHLEDADESRDEEIATLVPFVVDRYKRAEDYRYQDEERWIKSYSCLLYTSPSPRDGLLSRMPSSA